MKIIVGGNSKDSGEVQFREESFAVVYLGDAHVGAGGIIIFESLPSQGNGLCTDKVSFLRGKERDDGRRKIGQICNHSISEDIIGLIGISFI